MKTIKDVMSTSVQTVDKNANLQTAANQMSQSRIGFLPVVDENKKLVGTITDRDVALAVGKINKTPAEVKVQDIMSKTVHSVKQEDNATTALNLMRTKQVGRLPVVDKDQHLTGVVTLMGIARQIQNTPDKKELESEGPENILNTFYAIAERNDNRSGKERVSSM